MQSNPNISYIEIDTPAMFFDKQGQWETTEMEEQADLVILRKNPLEDTRNGDTIETPFQEDSSIKKQS